MVDLFNQNDKKKENRIILTPSPWRSAPFLLLAFVFALFGVLVIGGITTIEPLFADLQNSGTAITLFTVALFFFGTSFLFRAPRISVDFDAIKYITPFYKRSYSWEQVGPFFADSRHNHFNSSHYICAFTKEKHDSMMTAKQHQLPTVKNADIIISLHSLPPGKDIKSAQGFAVMVNSCRDEFETPAIQPPKHAVRRTGWPK